MDHSTFEEESMKIISRIVVTLTSKGDEYASKQVTDDRLIAFKEGAVRQKITSLECLRGYWDKHVGSIYDFINRTANGEVIELEKWQEKITDTIVYLILLEALIVEGRVALSELN